MHAQKSQPILDNLILNGIIRVKIIILMPVKLQIYHYKLKNYKNAIILLFMLKLMSLC